MKRNGKKTLHPDTEQMIVLFTQICSLRESNQRFQDLTSRPTGQSILGNNYNNIIKWYIF